MVEINIDMDYLFETQRVNKLQFKGRGLLDDNDIKAISNFKFQDGRILHWYGEVDNPLFVYDLDDEDKGVGEYIDDDEELSDSLNDSEAVIFAEYREI